MPEPTDKPPQNTWTYVSLFALMLFWFALIIAVFSSDSPNTTVPYSEFKSMLANGAIAQVKLDGQTITIVTKADANAPASPTGAQSRRPARTTFLPDMGDPNLMEQFGATAGRSVGHIAGCAKLELLVRKYLAVDRADRCLYLVHSPDVAGHGRSAWPRRIW